MKSEENNSPDRPVPEIKVESVVEKTPEPAQAAENMQSTEKQQSELVKQIRDITDSQIAKFQEILH